MVFELTSPSLVKLCIAEYFSNDTRCSMIEHDPKSFADAFMYLGSVVISLTISPEEVEENSK